MMNSSRFLSTTATRSLRVGALSRAFSSECAPAEKLRSVFEQYRQEHFSRETPQRFKKEMVKAAQLNDGTVHVDKLNEILINIGRPDQILSEAEMRQLLHEAGATEESRSIQTTTMLQFLYR